MSQPTAARSALLTVLRWFDTTAGSHAIVPGDEKRVDWLRVVPLVAAHLGCLLVFVVGWSPVAVFVAIALYALRMFSITGFYHRYFSHASFRAGRIVQFGMAVAGASCVQRGPVWWASHHRKHHAHADQPSDPHSPTQHGLLWSHFLWFASRNNFPTEHARVKDLSRFPELRFLDRFDTLVPALLAASTFGLGVLLERFAPSLGTNGPQMFVWGFLVSTVVLLHAALSINSLAHGPGDKPYPTRDQSRNSFWLALLTFGEGWHNNHHRFPSSVRMGFHWWQVDMTYYGLRAMQALGLIHDLVPIPAAASMPTSEAA